VLKGDSLISNYYGYSCQMSQRPLQRTHFVRSCGWGLKLTTLLNLMQDLRTCGSIPTYGNRKKQQTRIFVDALSWIRKHDPSVRSVKAGPDIYLRQGKVCYWQCVTCKHIITDMLLLPRTPLRLELCLMKEQTPHTKKSVNKWRGSPTCSPRYPIQH
jgi:hypothetical protein